MRKVFFLLILAAFALSVATSCGKKAAPHPPEEISAVRNAAA